MHRLPMVVLALLAAWPAAAADLPIRKAGLWELKMAFEGRNLPPQTMQQCTDPATDRMMTSNFGGPGREDCSKKDIRTSGNTITVDSVCKVGTMTVTSHAVVTGDFNSAYTVKVTSTREGGPPNAGPGGPTNITIDAKWTGACKADQRPGDMIMADGRKINIGDLQQMRGGPGAAGVPGGMRPPGMPAIPNMPQR